MRFSHEIERLQPQMVQWRRHLHQFPEPSFHEFETTAFILEHLQKWGIEARKGATGCGVIATVYGQHTGPTVALRADIDALPLQDAKQVDYASKKPNLMHACGHDGHTAALMAAALVLQSHRSSLKGNIRLLFQHAEETCPGGAISLIKEGALEDVAAIYGIHLWSPLPVGTVSSAAGPLMAAADEFAIEIQGKGGHGGFPHESIDSIHIGSQVVVNLQSIVSRKVDPGDACVISIGSFHAGDAFNIIPDSCRISGTVRTFDEQLRKRVQEQMNQIVEHTCKMHDAKAEIQYYRGYPALCNDRVEYERFREITGSLSCFRQVEVSPLIMAGEDFSYYLQKVPGCFMFVGAGNRQRGIDAFHHHPLFDIDEHALGHAAQLLLAMAMDGMEKI